MDDLTVRRSFLPVLVPPKQTFYTKGSRVVDRSLAGFALLMIAVSFFVAFKSYKAMRASARAVDAWTLIHPRPTLKQRGVYLFAVPLTDGRTVHVEGPPTGRQLDAEAEAARQGYTNIDLMPRPDLVPFEPIRPIVLFACGALALIFGRMVRFIFAKE